MTTKRADAGTTSRAEQIKKLEAENARLVAELNRVDRERRIFDDLPLCGRCAAQLVMRMGLTERGGR